MIERRIEQLQSHVQRRYTTTASHQRRHLRLQIMKQMVLTNMNIRTPGIWAWSSKTSVFVCKLSLFSHYRAAKTNYKKHANLSWRLRYTKIQLATKHWCYFLSKGSEILIYGIQTRKIEIIRLVNLKWLKSLQQLSQSCSTISY